MAAFIQEKPMKSQIALAAVSPHWSQSFGTESNISPTLGSLLLTVKQQMPVHLIWRRRTLCLSYGDPRQRTASIVTVSVLLT
jgi:hypothetical protein